MATQNRIARWVEKTEQCSPLFKSPFGPRSDLGTDDDVHFPHGHYIPHSASTVLPSASASQVAAHPHPPHHHSSRRSRHGHSHGHHHQHPGYVMQPPQLQYDYPGHYSPPPYPGQPQYMPYPSSPSPYEYPPSPYEYPSSPMGYPSMPMQYPQGQPGYVILPRKHRKFKVVVSVLVIQFVNLHLTACFFYPVHPTSRIFLIAPPCFSQCSSLSAASNLRSICNYRTSSSGTAR